MRRLTKGENLYEYIQFLKDILKREKDSGIFANLTPYETAETEKELKKMEEEYNKLKDMKKL
jgi:ribosomal protein S2